jgi:hypothetical protein
MLEIGITHDPCFETWANMVHSYDEYASMDLSSHKRDLTLEVMNDKAVSVTPSICVAGFAIAGATSIAANGQKFHCQRGVLERFAEAANPG